MDVHPTKNDINRYWSIPIWQTPCLGHACHFRSTFSLEVTAAVRWADHASSAHRIKSHWDQTCNSLSRGTDRSWSRRSEGSTPGFQHGEGKDAAEISWSWSHADHMCHGRWIIHPFWGMVINPWTNNLYTRNYMYIYIIPMMRVSIVMTAYCGMHTPYTIFWPWHIYK